MIRNGYKFVVQDADTDAESKRLGKSSGIYGFGREGVIVLSGSRLPFINTMDCLSTRAELRLTNIIIPSTKNPPITTSRFCQFTCRSSLSAKAPLNNHHQ